MGLLETDTVRAPLLPLEPDGRRRDGRDAPRRSGCVEAGRRPDRAARRRPAEAVA